VPPTTLVVTTLPVTYRSTTPTIEDVPCTVFSTSSVLVIDVNDTAVTVEVMDGMGEITVPRRWLIASQTPEAGLDTEFYFSCMNVTGKRDLPQRFI
jgi:hypothetical protein